MKTALVNKIIPFSSVDGPGNRTSIFLQECDFNCLYCHNPETINKCKNCLDCVSKCPVGALSVKNNKVLWDKSLCVKCDACIKSCKFNASPKVQEMTVNDILDEIKKFQPFIEGITVSGGECTLQKDFLIDLFREVKKLGLTCFADTNGSIPLFNDDEFLNVMDKAMIDFKSYDLNEHKNLTSLDNKVVIENIEKLIKLDKVYEIRTVIVPDILNNEYNVDKISKLIASLNPNIIYKLIKYRPMGVRNDLIKSRTPSNEFMDKLCNIAKKNNLKNIICV